MNLHLTIFATAAAAALSVSAAEPEYFVKELTFPAQADSATKIEMASRLVPSPMQKAWQERELTAFIHFGMNTFTNREWGDGREQPGLFNPTDLDTDQWVRTLRDAGFKMVILTAKHHDGFCLWPTATTSHSVASTSWRDGKGDVVADLRRSCDKYGMKLGIYLSPWDRNAECYGDSPRYNDMFVAQLTELLTNYGTIDEVWFDGACGEGPNGKKQVYDWLRYREVMRRLQPDAVLAITGDDVRWVGNEGGRGRETEWSVTPLTPSIFEYSDSVNSSLGIDNMSAQLGDRGLIARARKLYWWPSEVDVSIRPGWFYHATEQPHSLQRMAEIYLQSVGRNSVLLLNIPPDTRGLISAADSIRLMELRHWIDTSFSTNLLGQPEARVNTVVLEEDISHGQRVEAFDLMAQQPDGSWMPIASGTTIGKKRIITFDPVPTGRLKLNIISSRATPHASIAGAYFIVMPDDQSAADAAADAGLAPIPADAYTAVALNSGPTPTCCIRFAAPQSIAGFTYAPRTEPGQPNIFKYSAMVSADGIHWQSVDTYGEFSNIQANPIEQTVVFTAPVEAAYLSIVCLEPTAPGLSVDPQQIIPLAVR